MIVLGVTHPIGWNTGAALLIDARLVGIAEEERFIRVKHAPRTIPVNAVDYLLREGNIGPQDVDVVAVGHNGPKSLPGAVPFAIKGCVQGEPPKSEAWFAVQSVVKDEELVRYATKLFPRAKLIRVPHHISHAASAYFVSGFKKSMVMTLDGRGELDSGLLGEYDGGELEVFRSLGVRESLGNLYGHFTDLLGFRYHSDEGKTMGLAPYGKPIDSLLDLIESSEMALKINWNRIRGLTLPSPLAADPTLDGRKDLAATVQFLLEKAALGLLGNLSKLCGSRNICLAGGTALNIDMNSRILRSGLVDSIFISPASHDSGCSLGAALHVHHELTGEMPPMVMEDAYLGPSFKGEQVKASLNKLKVGYETLDDGEIPDRVSSLLAEGKIVGWMRGRLEVGPRALGARSILASPKDKEMNARLNTVKGREWWRPLAPSILEEESGDYFLEARKSPFMLLRFATTETGRKQLPAAIHVDNSSRPQTVSRKSNPVYWETIKEFQKTTGVPAVINTSLNAKGEPIVCNPVDAVRTFYSTGMDSILIENCLIEKQRT